MEKYELTKQNMLEHLDGKGVSMSRFPQDVRFRGQWRSYQQRVLVGLNKYLSDECLHIVAPPGSGKTVLGLEVALRLNRPTVVFAPTIVVRDQWVQRFCEHFLQTPEMPDWISVDLRQPGFLTVVTYQALYAVVTGGEKSKDLYIYDSEDETIADEDFILDVPVPVTELAERLSHVGTIVLDEAHHLKKEWARTLLSLKSALKVKTVALTATPPFDVTPSEWRRYIALNGEIDMEISVPELVRERELCPHQDLLLLSMPMDDELESIASHREKAARVYEEMMEDPLIQKEMLDHPYIRATKGNWEFICKDIVHFCALLSYLIAKQAPFPGELLSVLKRNPWMRKKVSKEGVEEVDFSALPPFDSDQANVLLTTYLDEEDQAEWKRDPAHLRTLRDKLKANGLLRDGSPDLSMRVWMGDKLLNSKGKMDSIVRVVEAEYASLQHRLRMVILSDFIRKEYMPNSPENDLPLNKFGVLPIFEKLRRRSSCDVLLGVLTGSVILLPHSSMPLLREIAGEKGLPEDALQVTPLPYDEAYVRVAFENEGQLRCVVGIVTELFERGGVEVLVGTKSLLGEGWDAPFVNSLVMASLSGSYVGSNQMRGRAIRCSAADANKTSNIWHLACVDPYGKMGGEDLAVMRRRFRSFVGVSSTGEPLIESGIERLSLPTSFLPSEVEKYNARVMEEACQREALSEKWGVALGKGEEFVEMVRVPYPEENFNYGRFMTTTRWLSIADLFSQWVGLVVLIVCIVALLCVVKIPYVFCWIAGAIALLVSHAKIRSVCKKRILRHGNLNLLFSSMAWSLLYTMRKHGLLETSSVSLYVHLDKHGNFECCLRNASMADQKKFTQAFEEAVSNTGNARYYIVRDEKSVVLGDYERICFAVPEVIGQKEMATEYLNLMKDYVGPLKLVYSRNMEGLELDATSRLESMRKKYGDGASACGHWI